MECRLQCQKCMQGDRVNASDAPKPEETRMRLHDHEPSTWSLHHYEGAAGPVRMPGKAKPKAKGPSHAKQATRKSATKSKSPPKAGAKAKPGASEASRSRREKREKVAVVAFGRQPAHHAKAAAK